MKPWVWPTIAAIVLIGTASMGILVAQVVPLLSDRDAQLAWGYSSARSGERNSEAVPLYTAVIHRDHEALARLLDHGTSPNLLLSKGGWSPLITAASLLDYDAVELLVRHGADLNYVSDQVVGVTPLDGALTFGVPHENLTVFRYLMAKGANINLVYPNEDDIAIHAVTIGQMHLANELLDHGYDRDFQELLEVLNIRLVNEETQPEKERAIMRVKAMIKSRPESR